MVGYTPPVLTQAHSVFIQVEPPAMSLQPKRVVLKVVEVDPKPT